ncbi:hypothetical protein [Bacillus marinisedimentorum]|uniref:hypothetical protein n=1 Tax=Bacillus marinisedimentorum TaxID=1821260 RepID=UPI000872B24F|nr:hypothetical protein [Bacillus marinisedimentorum]
MTLVLPILLLVTFAAITPILMRKRNAAGFTYMSARKLKWMLGGYGTLLLLAASIALILSANTPEDSARSEVPGRQEIQKAARAGKLSQLEGIRMDKKWEMAFEESELMVELRESGHRDSLLFYEEDPASDGMIEVEYYRPPSLYKGMDLSEQIPPPGMLLNGSTLTINHLSSLKLDFTGIEKEFITKHFTTEGSSFENALHPEEIMWNMEKSVILVRVPEGTDVVSGAHSFIEKLE